MNLIYCDEHDEQKKNEERYSAAIACGFESSSVFEARFDLVSGLRSAFKRSENEAMDFPVLHACDLPRSFTDDKKIELFAFMLSCAEKYCSFIYRVGYGWENKNVSAFSVKPDPQINARLASYSHMFHDLSMELNEDTLFIQEHDKNNYDLFNNYLNSTKNFERLEQIKHARNHLKYVVGYHYAPKQDHMLYIVDFVSYYLKLKGRRQPSDFQKRLLDNSPDLSKLLRLNRLVYE